MKKISVLFLAIICSTALFSQSVDYDLSSFKVPETVYRTLTFNFNNESSFTTNRENDLDNSQFHKELKNDFYLSSSFYQYYNTKKFQGSFNVSDGISVDNSLKNSHYSSIDSKQIKYSIDNLFKIRTYNRFYFDKLFILGNLQVTTNNGFSKNILNILEDVSTTKSIRNSYYLNPEIGIGIGRIDQVQDARLAVYILDDIVSGGMNLREIAEEDINKLGELIAKIKKERFFDSRIKKMKDLSEITEFLKSEGIINKESVEFFTAVNDKWDYAYGPVRSRGQRFSVSFVHEGYNNFSDYFHMDTLSHNSSQKELENAICLDFTYEKPISLKWQLSASFNASYLLETTKSESYTAYNFYNDTLKNDKVSFTPSVTISYYPNTRTYVNASLSYRIYYQDWNRTYDFSEAKEIDSNIYFVIRTGYYISPQLRLYAKISIVDDYYKSYSLDNMEDEFQIYTYAGLSYSLF